MKMLKYFLMLLFVLNLWYRSLTARVLRNYLAEKFTTM